MPPIVSPYQPPAIKVQFSLRHGLILMTVIAIAAAILAIPLRGISPGRWLLFLAAAAVSALAFGTVTINQSIRFRRQLLAIGTPLGDIRYRSRTSTIALIGLVLAQLALTGFILAIITTSTDAWRIAQSNISQPILLGIVAAALNVHIRIGGRLVYGMLGATDGKQFYPWKSVTLAPCPGG